MTNFSDNLFKKFKHLLGIFINELVIFLKQILQDFIFITFILIINSTYLVKKYIVNYLIN
jgi:hypothetical protein